MIRSLEDAWRWYGCVQKLIGMMDRIAGRYWDRSVEDRTLKDTLHRDNRFREYAAGEIREMVQTVKEDLDEIAVLILFSVFEANVRDQILEDIERELTPPPQHPILQKAANDARDTALHGSFGRLMEPFKSLDADLKGKVDQVRKFRNWMAHGRRGTAENNVDPVAARERLEKFLKLMTASQDDPSVLPAARDSPQTS